MSSLRILDLSNNDAKAELLKPESYCNFELPEYFDFKTLLKEIEKKLVDKNLTFGRSTTPNDFENVNYKIIHNKDGKYGWRPLQLINPILYVSLVDKMTSQENWILIVKKFSEFSSNKKIKCVSHPVCSKGKRSNKAEQILYYIDNFEQKSIEMALDYKYVVQVDVSDCYSSIYTHSVVWALHGLLESKSIDGRNNKEWIGNIIDKHLRWMNRGQSNGIPQGSVVMDLIAEIVFGYSDLELSAKIEEMKISDYQILRYRDDYRIFANNPRDAEAIAKAITELLIKFGLKLNSSKISYSEDIINSSIKPDKLFLISKESNLRNLKLEKFLNFLTKSLSLNKEKNKKLLSSALQSQAIAIYNFAKNYPNSGSLTKALILYRKEILGGFILEDDPRLHSLISVITNIALRNPKCYPICSAILSKLVDSFNLEADKSSVVEKIKKKFSDLPSTGFMEIWLQRFSITFDKTISYQEPLCKVVSGEKTISELWDIGFMNSGSDVAKTFLNQAIIDEGKIDKLRPIITDKEVEVFYEY